MKKLWLSLTSNFVPLSYLISIPILNIFYGLLNSGSRGMNSLMTDLDRSIPFLKAFIVPYVLWYPFIFAVFVYLCIRDRQTYYRTLIIFNVGLLVCYFIYFTYQTTVPRPVLIDDDWMTQIVRWIYSNDQPFNCFPSIHVFTSYLMARAVQMSAQTNKSMKIGVMLLATIIILSTVFVKQHVVLDIAGAILTVEALTLLIIAFLPLLRIRYASAKRLYYKGEGVQWHKKPYSLSTTRRKF